MTPRPSPREPETEPETETGRAAKAAAILGAILTVGALGLYGSRAALSVAIGALIAIANLLTMRAIIRALIQAPVDESPPETGGGLSKTASAEENAENEGEKKEPVPNAVHRENGRRGGYAWGLFAVFKIFILFGGIWILLTRDLVDPIPLVVGYGVLPLGIAASSLWSSLGPRRR